MKHPANSAFHPDPIMPRRDLLKSAIGGAVAAVAARSGLPAFALAEEPAKKLAGLVFPEKLPLINLTDRPPNLEMPLKYFRDDLTPNEAFYVRWHLAILPTRVDLADYRLKLGGHVEKPVEWSLDELKKSFEPVSVVARRAGRV